MSEGREGQQPGGGYPSAGFSEEPAAPADPFGPQSVAEAGFDPFAASPPTTATSAVPFEAARDDVVEPWGGAEPGTGTAVAAPPYGLRGSPSSTAPRSPTSTWPRPWAWAARRRIRASRP
ncbi:hypothetical protein NBM05_09890 [Rothia sp. AR01]|uniref:Uncharacterized protein n=1 Tax=Rothia santali TaxID=2949643 RepID=A0A9X2HJZ5_9MICC|nr:hypothetical protein [Rothia santali]MCP3426303.1 hypothetical protein [Rothia santali]